MKLLTAALLLLLIAMCLASAEGKSDYSAYSHKKLFSSNYYLPRDSPELDLAACGGKAMWCVCGVR